MKHFLLGLALTLAFAGAARADADETQWWAHALTRKGTTLHKAGPHKSREEAIAAAWAVAAEPTGSDAAIAAAWAAAAAPEASAPTWAAV